MRNFLIGISVATAIAGAHAQAADDTTSPTPTPTATSRTFGFARLLMKLNEGEEWGSPHVGLFCTSSPKIMWRGGQSEVRNTEFVDAFREEARAAGFKADGDNDSIFEQNVSTSDLQIGAIINEAELDYCSTGNNLTGHANLGIQWQIYSVVQKAVLAKIDTKAGFELKTSTPGTPNLLMVGAFRNNA